MRIVSAVDSAVSCTIRASSLSRSAAQACSASCAKIADRDICAFFSASCAAFSFHFVAAVATFAEESLPLSFSSSSLSEVTCSACLLLESSSEALRYCSECSRLISLRLSSSSFASSSAMDAA